MEAFNCDWSHTHSWRRSTVIDYTHSHDGGVQLRLIKSIGKVTRELTKVINGRIELVKCSRVGRRIAKGFDKGCRGGSRQRIDRGLNTSSEDLTKIFWCWQRFEHIVRGESLLIHRHSNAFRTLHNHMGTTLVVTHGRENSKHPIWCTLTLRPERDWFQLTFFEATWVLSESRTVAAARSLWKLWSGRPTMSGMYV